MRTIPFRRVFWAGSVFVLFGGISFPSSTYPKNTVDREKLRNVLQRSMTDHAGAAVVVNVETGEILVAHDLATAAHRLARPGSTVKPFVLMALLESGRLDPNQRLLCQRPLRIGGVRMDCTHPDSILNLNAEEAIAYSCNSYFSEAATRLSGEQLVQAFRRAGLDSSSGLANDETRGRIELPRDQDMLRLEALGDRGIEVTPLELLGAYRKLALLKRNGALAIGIDAPVFAGLEQSVTYGMAHAANVEHMKIAGKTGTAASRESARTHGFFVGFAPAERPEIAVVVYLEHDSGGDAARVAQALFEEFAKE